MAKSRAAKRRAREAKRDTIRGGPVTLREGESVELVRRGRRWDRVSPRERKLAHDLAEIMWPSIKAELEDPGGYERILGRFRRPGHAPVKPGSGEPPAEPAGA